MRVSFVYRDEDWRTAIDDIEKFSRYVLKSTFKIAGVKPVAGSEVSVLLTNDAEIMKLNKKWRGKDKATDVLSFPTDDEMLPGDIVISLCTLLHDAKLQGKSFRTHYARLLVHGALHLLGFDHMDKYDADEMEFFEAKILKEVGL